MKIFSDNVPTTTQIDEINKKQTQDIAKLKKLLSGVAIFNLAITVILFTIILAIK